MKEHGSNWKCQLFLGGGLSLKKLMDQKIRYATKCYELEAVLLNLNYKFDKVSRDKHVQVRNHYSFNDKLKLSLNFELAATQEKIAKKLFYGWNIKIWMTTFNLSHIYISILMIFKMLCKIPIFLKFFLVRKLTI